MTTSEVVREIERQGMNMRRDGNDIIVRPAHKLTPFWRSTLVEYAPAIVAAMPDTAGQRTRQGVR